MTYRITPWSRAGKSRIYVSLDGRKVGHFDPDADDASRFVADRDSADPARDIEHVRTALTQRMGISTSTVRIAPHRWSDLAGNAPGAMVARAADLSGAAAGIAAEQRTAGVLSPLLNLGWRLINSIPLGPVKDLDHLLIGPVGVVAINTKFTSYPVQISDSGKVTVDGYSKSWIDSIVRDSELVASQLSAACRESVRVLPLVVLWCPSLNGADRHVVLGSQMVTWLSGNPQIFDRAWVSAVFDQARRSDIWTRTVDGGHHL